MSNPVEEMVEFVKAHVLHVEAWQEGLIRAALEGQKISLGPLPRHTPYRPFLCQFAPPIEPAKEWLKVTGV